MAQFQLGSISTGTLRTEDLLEAFAATLNGLDKDHALIPQALDLLSMDDWTDEQSYLASDITDEISDALNNLCPPFVHFGSLDGDGADFGFWPDTESLGDALQDAAESSAAWDWSIGDYILGDVMVSQNIAPFDGVIVHVSDHGNVTVMDMDRNILWSVV